MSEPTDAELLRRYAGEKSEEAFAELVRRHLDLVYSVALRQVGGDGSLAEDVTQVVFTALARKAEKLAERPVLGGWLYRTAQFAAIDAVRAESRRRARETEAQTMHELTTNPGAAIDWDKLRPTLDRAVGELKDDDRDAVVLRFFEGRSFADVGAKLRLTENAARMRVERALDKLHAALARRGVTSTAAAVGVALANQATVAAPAGLAASVTGAVVTTAVAGSVTDGLVTFMSMTKLQIGIAAAFVVAGTAGLVVQAQTRAELEGEVIRLRQATQPLVQVREENQRDARRVAEVAVLRRDDAELVRLQDEATALALRLPPSIQKERFVQGTIVIGGQVKHAGTIAIPPDGTLTLGEAIARANGFSETAATAKIRVTRRMANGTTQMIPVDASTDGAFVLQPDDTVYVTEKMF